MKGAGKRWPTWLSWSIAAISILLGVLAPIAVVLGWSDADLGDGLLPVLSTITFLLVGPVYGVVGAAIVSNQSGNSIGWVLVTVSTGMTASVLAEVFVPSTPPTDLSVVAGILLAAGGLSWVFFIFPVLHLMLTFPTGKVLSRAWTPFLALEVIAVTYVLFTGLFAETVSALDGLWTAENPIGFIPDTWDNQLVSTAFQTSLLVLLSAGVVSTIIRYRRSVGAERQQLKGLLFAVAFFGFVFAGLALFSGDDSQLADLLLPWSLIGIGIAVGVAVLRYRLYEIDRFISRTVTYALVVGLLTAVVAGVATVVGTRFQTPLVVASTTLAVAAAFNPLRRRVQDLVDRRFNRSRYDIERVMNRFAASLRDRVEDLSIAADWRDVVVDTMQPSAAGVWVKQP